jgi:hypothetical protein
VIQMPKERALRRVLFEELIPGELNAPLPAE